MVSKPISRLWSSNGRPRQKNQGGDQGGGASQSFCPTDRFDSRTNCFLYQFFASLIRVSNFIQTPAPSACHLDLFRTDPDSAELSRTRGIRCDRASRCDEKWKTAMLKIAMLLFAAGLLSGCASMGFDAYNARPDPTAPSRLQYALEHQPQRASNECVVLGADYVWRACQGGRLVPALR
jgi:hypothetical protein